MDGAIALPAPGQPTTHILKPPIARFPATTENEAFIMGLARAVGLEVAPVEARSVQNRPFLLVQRYDRVVDRGLVRRIHHEDVCQALGVPPETKYAAEGGPGFRECFGLLRRVAARPAVDVLKLLDAAIFNLTVGNADAHGKNLSLLYDAPGPRLAPLYDLLSTIAYPALSAKLAIKIGRRATLEEMDAAAWAAFAVNAGLGLPLVRRRMRDLASRVEQQAQSTAEQLVSPGLDRDALERLADTVKRRALAAAATVKTRA